MAETLLGFLRRRLGSPLPLILLKAVLPLGLVPDGSKLSVDLGEDEESWRLVDGAIGRWPDMVVKGFGREPLRGL